MSAFHFVLPIDNQILLVYSYMRVYFLFHKKSKKIRQFIVWVMSINTQIANVMNYNVYAHIFKHISGWLAVIRFLLQHEFRQYWMGCTM